MKLKTKPANVMAQYLKVKERYADLMNLGFFKGENIINPDKLYQWDSDSSTLFSDRNLIESVGKRRNNIMVADIEGLPVIVALEHQQKINYSMCHRLLNYDDISYNQQYHAHGKQKENLHPIPVVSAVLYTGEKRWKQPRTLFNRMNIPECMKDKINNWNGHIIDIKDIDARLLKCEDNYQLVTAVQKLYKWKKDINAIADMKLKKEVAIVVSTIIGEEELTGRIENEKEEVINMCKAIREYREEGIQLGEEKGLKKGIKLGEESGLKKGVQLGEHKGILTTLLIVLKNQLGNLSKDTIEKLERSSIEQLNTLTFNLFEITKEQDILSML